MSDEKTATDFIRQIVRDDVEGGRHQTVVTRFPPEPNGFLHIGHAKSICLNFGIAEEFGGRCHLRFDDTNPSKEEQRYIDSIQEDVRWLGFDWGEHLHFASDYFEQLYEWAEHLVRAGNAYVDSQSAEEIRSGRGSLREPGTNSPYRDRPAEESLDLLRRMRAGEFEEGAHVLRARIDMASPNLNLRDPVLYRIMRQEHPRTGDKWCIYPMYDFAHGQSDAIEAISHSICTLEFENHRPLYDWFLEHLPVPAQPRQYEFARLNLSFTVTSKRKLLKLVEEGVVSGWDDPRMPTLSGLRRRGYTPTAVRRFCQRTGVTKTEGVVEIALLEHTIREELNSEAVRRMAVLQPLKFVIENWPEGQVEEREVPNMPGKEELGSRKVPLGREIWIERNDFREEPPRKFHRLGPGREVRLRYGYNITCTEVIKNDAGEVVELRGSYDPESKDGGGRKVKGIIHWVPVADCLETTVRLYDHLFTKNDPQENGEDFFDNLNDQSLQVVEDAKLEPSLAEAAPGSRVQFERNGYFYVDDKDSTPGQPVFHRIVGLRDSWAKIEKKQG